MSESRLPKARRRIELMRSTTRDAVAFETGTVASLAQPTAHPIQAPACWLATIGLANPLGRAESCGDILETALYSGIPRLLNEVTPPDGHLPLMRALLRDRINADTAVQLHEEREKWENQAAAPSVIVALASEFDFQKLTLAIQGLDGDDGELFRPWFLAARFARLLIDLSNGSTECERLRDFTVENWTTQIDSFFGSTAFRGVRRRAARIGGKTWASEAGGVPIPLLQNIPSPAFENPGFRSFAEEWIHAQGRAQLQRPSFETPDISELLRIASMIDRFASDTGGPGSWASATLNRLWTDRENGLFGDFDD